MTVAQIDELLAMSRASFVGRVVRGSAHRRVAGEYIT